MHDLSKNPKAGYLKYMKIYFYIFAFLLVFSPFNTLTAQNTHARITIQGGNSTMFNFNSWQRLTDGITINDYTRLNIYFVDTTDLGIPSGALWHLSGRFVYPVIAGASNSLDLDKVEIQISSIPAGSTNNAAGWITLNENFTVLVSDGPNMTNGLVTISYRVGDNDANTNSLFGEPPDFYYVELEFFLEKQP